MSKLTKLGLAGFLLTLIITGVVVLSGGSYLEIAPFFMPFSVMILIGLTRNKHSVNEKLDP